MYKHLSKKITLLLILLLASTLFLAACNSRSSGRERIQPTAKPAEDTHSEESFLGDDYNIDLAWYI